MGMEAALPEIDHTMVTDKALVQTLQNILKRQSQQIAKLTTALAQANEENARLKGQPKKPLFPRRKQPAISVTGFLKEKKQWQKRKWVGRSEEVKRA